MESRTIPASELPQISGLIKDVINMGLWFLIRHPLQIQPRCKIRIGDR